MLWTSHVFGPTMPGFRERPRLMMGFLDKLFRRGDADPAHRTDFEVDNQICVRCGKPIPRANLALDSGGGRPIHRVCPKEDVAEPGN
jgi:hypothetical protein